MQNTSFNSSYFTTQATVSQTAQSSNSYTRWDMIFWSTLQWVIFAVGTAGNLVVITVLVWNRSRSQVVTQLFVGSLSMAGLALMLSSGWVQGVVFVTNNFSLGTAACKAYLFLQAEGTFCNGWNLVVVAADRFLSVNKPGKESFVSVKWAVVMVTAIWVFTAVTNVPLLFWSDVSMDIWTGTLSCLVTGVDPTARAAQIMFVRIVNYFVPLAITWICYVGLIIKTKTALDKVVPSTAGLSTVSNTATNQSGSVSSRKVTVMCVAIAFCFTVTSLPLQIILLVVAYASPLVSAYINTLIIYFRVGTMLNVCTNPFVYGLLWRPFRTALIKAIEDNDTIAIV